MTIATEGARAETILPEEAAHFGALAADWWNPKGTSAMLHRLNPVRLGFIREAIDSHWPSMRSATRPLAGKLALDAGCGAGLLCEPLARLGAHVTGVDAAVANVEAAQAHAEAMNLQIDYRHGELADLGLRGFDVVCAMEVIEHVADKRAFLEQLALSMAPDGLMILSCPNRTVRSRIILVGAAEAIGAVPRGTHNWLEFVTPDELRELLETVGLTMGDPRGISWSPANGLYLSADTSLNYIVTAIKK